MFKLVCGPIEDSDQFAHLFSLIIVLNGHYGLPRVLFSGIKLRLSDCACADPESFVRGGPNLIYIF